MPVRFQTCPRFHNSIKHTNSHTHYVLMQCDDGVVNNDSEAFIESQTGVRQGDPLAALLFCIAVRGVYESVASCVSGGCFAYVDDNHAVGSLTKCWEAWLTVQDALHPLGLEVNAAKCEITCFYQDELGSDTDRAALASFRSAGVRVNCEWVSVLGCVIGRDNQLISTVLLTDPKYRDTHTAAFRRLPLLGKPTGSLALRHLDGVVLTNRLRAMPPAATAEHVVAYDAAVLAAARQLTGVTAAQGAVYDEQLISPLSEGGFGLVAAVHTAPAAYLAGVENTLRCSPSFTAIWADSTVAVPLSPTSQLYASIDDSLRRVAGFQTVLSARCEQALVDRASSLVLPASAASFVQHYRRAPPQSSIQHSITHRITTLSSIARVCEGRKLGKAGLATVARLEALREPGSSLWLQTLPTHPGLTLTDAKWLWAAQLRLGMPVPTTSSHCAACKVHDIYTTDSWHALTCVARSGALITRRHNSILDVVAKYCKVIDVAVSLNPAGGSDLDERRADIEVYLPDRTIVGDVTVSHPSAKSWRARVAKNGVHIVGDKREAAKNKMYKAMTEQHDKEFQAIVMYTYGGLHLSAKKFFNAICDSLDPALCLLSATEFSAELHAHVAIALQRGNAAIMIEDFTQTRMSEPQRTRRRWTAMRRAQQAAVAAAAASDDSRRGAGEDGAWLMRHDVGEEVITGEVAASAEASEIAADNACINVAAATTDAVVTMAVDSDHGVRGVCTSEADRATRSAGSSASGNHGSIAVSSMECDGDVCSGDVDVATRQQAPASESGLLVSSMVSAAMDKTAMDAAGRNNCERARSSDSAWAAMPNEPASTVATTQDVVMETVFTSL